MHPSVDQAAPERELEIDWDSLGRVGSSAPSLRDRDTWSKRSDSPTAGQVWLIDTSPQRWDSGLGNGAPAAQQRLLCGVRHHIASAGP